MNRDEENRTNNKGDSSSNSAVNFGTGNIFWGSFGDIAGRDINKPITIYQEIQGGVLTLETRKILELQYIELVLEELKQWSKRFIDINLKVEIPKKLLLLGDDLSSMFNGEVKYITEEDTGTQQTTTVIFEDRLEYLFKYSNKWELLGEAGSGKTSLLRKLTHHYAEKTKFLLMNEDSNSELIETKKSIPIFLNLKSYNQEITLLELLEKSWLGNPLGLEIQRYLSLGQLVILFDELDRVVDGLIPKVVQEIRDLSESYPKNRIIVSVRNLSISFDVGFSKAYVQKLSIDQSQELLWRYWGEEGRNIFNLIKDGQKDLLWTLENPYTALVLSLVASNTPNWVAKSTKSLMQRFVKILIYKEATNQNILQDEDNLFKLLSLLAFDLVQGNNVTLSEDEYQQIVLFGRNLGVIRIDETSGKTEYVHSLLESFFSGMELQNQMRQDPTLFESIFSLSKVPEFELDFPRAKVFEKSKINENPWDSKTPLLKRNIWFESIKMSYSENDFAELVASINEINPILLSDLMLSVNLSLSDGIIEGIKKSLLNIMTSVVYHKRIRFTAGYWLAKLGDTRFDNYNFIIIPEKQGFQIGDASRSCLVDIKKFSVSKYLVTNQEFKLFKENRGYANKAFWSDQGWQWVKSTKRSQPSFWEDERFNLPNCPVVGISWFEAEAYAKWKNARLLTEIEWEYLATYYEPTKQKRKFPWGDSYEDDRANVMMGKYLFEPSPVGMFPKGANHWGVDDLAGNVWEWCSSLYLPYPYDQSKSEKRNVLGWRCLRGGSWYFDKQAGALGYTRFFGDPLNGEGFNRGFRIAKDEE